MWAGGCVKIFILKSLLTNLAKIKLQSNFDETARIFTSKF